MWVRYASHLEIGGKGGVYKRRRLSALKGGWWKKKKIKGKKWGMGRQRILTVREKGGGKACVSQPLGKRNG